MGIPTPVRIGIIGGSGLQRLLDLRNAQRISVETPFGAPSDAVVLGDLAGVPVAFLQRHGPGHAIPPTNINVRANIAALRRLGCAQLLSVSAVGSLREECPPETFVLIDQFIDRTFAREKTFFGPGLVGHVAFGDPTCDRVRSVLAASAAAIEIPLVASGTYVVMEGPQFSTRAESHLYRQWGGTVIGMTGMPEAKLAREAEMCYAMIAVPTDYDCWHQVHASVTAEMVSRRMEQVVERANRLIEHACRQLVRHTGSCAAGCDRALDSAIMTHPDHRNSLMVARVGFVVPRLLTQRTTEGER